MADSLLDALNPEQQEAVLQTEGYVRLHAGAGTGKTRTLTYRYAYLINEFGMSPRSVWCVTFTNKAALEMKKRVFELCGDIGNPFISTFHSFCASFLREEISCVGWPSNFTIIDVNEVKELIGPLYDICKVDGRKFNLKRAWEYIDQTKETLDYISDLIAANSDVLLQYSNDATEDKNKIFWRYLYSQRTCYCLDFDDLILLTLYILNNFPKIREKWQSRFEYILVDEFQDIDRDQYALVELLAAKNHNLFIVGDPDQTIYSFRGARVEFFNNFIERHGNEAINLYLTYNYRSQEHILNAAYDVICNNHDTVRKPLQAMRNDVKLEQMIAVLDPNPLDGYNQMSDAVSSTISKRSMLGDCHFNQDNQGAMPKKGSINAQYYARNQVTIEQNESLALNLTNEDPDELITCATLPLRAQEPALLLTSSEDLSVNSVQSQEQHESQAKHTNKNELKSITNNLVSQAQKDKISLVVPITQFDSNIDPKGYSDPYAYLDLRPIVVHAKNVYVEAEHVVKCIENLRRFDLRSSIAVLYRTHHAVVAIENALMKARIPFRVFGEIRFFDRKEIKDVLAYVRLLVNVHDDVAFKRAVNVPPRSFGKKRMEHLERLARQDKCSLYTALMQHQDDEFLYKRSKIKDFVKILTVLKGHTVLGRPLDDLEMVLSISSYEEWIKSSGENERLDNISTLKNYINEYQKEQEEHINLADFLNAVALLTSSDDRGKLNEVQLMTVHNAKGLEFDYVFLISMNEAIFPSKKSISCNEIDEERRLMYVAMTRAMKQLIISEAGGAIYTDNNNKVSRVSSRFIQEIDAHHYIQVGGKALVQEYGQDKEVVTKVSQCSFKVGDFIFSKSLGKGRIDDINYTEAEYSIFFFKLQRNRTLSFKAKLELYSEDISN